MSKKYGWLVVNGFLKSEKFNTLYGLLIDAALKKDVYLSVVTTDQLISFIGEEEKLKLPAFVLFWDKDVNLAYRLEQKGVAVFNCAKAILACDDKALTATILTQNKVAHPKTIIAPKTFEGVNFNTLYFLNNVEKLIEYPLIIKESFGSFGKQVYLALNRDEAEEIIKKLGYKPFIVQEFIKTSRGKDIRVNVVGDKIVAAYKRFNDLDFRSNVTLGGQTKACELTENQKDLALKVARIFNLDFCGIDLLYGENDEPICCEVNSNPHFKSTLDATGVNVAEEIISYVLKKME